MKYDLDKMMRELYQEDIKPDTTLNQRTLLKMKMKESGRMNKSGYFKKAVAVVALVCLVSVGGLSAYAAIYHTSLLSLFKGESREIQDTANRLLQTDVSQKSVSDKEQTQYAAFSVREAICDKNTVNVQVVVTPAKEDYLLVPSEYWSEIGTLNVASLSIDGVGKTKDSIQAYADKVGKKCIRVGADIQADADSQSIDYMTEADGTLVYSFSFENTSKNSKLEYVCDTLVYTSKDGNDASLIRDSFTFTLKDNSGDVKTIQYVPENNKVIDGTQLVLDSVDIDKSALEIKCNIKYHSVDKKAKDWDKWTQTEDSDLFFYLLDEKGKVIDFKEGCVDSNDKGGFTQTIIYSLQDLPDSLTFLVKNCMTKEEIGTVTVSKK